jgi:protein ImuB
MWSVELAKRRAKGHEATNAQTPGGNGAGRGENAPPILLVSVTGQRQLLERCCERAWAAGVRPGMDVTQARALLPVDAVRIEAFSPSRDGAALERLARWALRFTPRVALDPPDGLKMDIAGCQRLFRGESRLARHVAEGVARLGFTVRLCVAPTFGSAWAMARYGNTETLPHLKFQISNLKFPSPYPPCSSFAPSVYGFTCAPGRAVSSWFCDEPMVIEPLSVRSLRIAEETVEALCEVGITRVGDVMRLPRELVTVRFGPELLLRLDQSLGRVEERIEPVREVEPVRVERSFDGAATQIEAIEIASRELLEELCAELDKRQRGTRRIDVELVRLDATPLHIAVSLGRPRRSLRHLWSLLRVRLEGVNLGYGVERIAMTARGTSRLRHEQLEWREGSHPKEVEASQGGWEMIDTLVNRLGRQRVLRPELVESHVPERAARLTGWDEEENRKAGKQENRKAKSKALVRSSASGAKGGWGDRPSLLLERPEPARVIAVTPDGPVVRLSWRGRERAIVSCVGPERIAGEWWRQGTDARPPRHDATRERDQAKRANHGFEISNSKFEIPDPRSSEIADSRSAHGHRADTVRDYFKVQDEDGRCLWLFREGPDAGHTRWFVHGEWA